MIGVDKGTELQNHQDALIDNVFGHRGIPYLVKNQKTDTITHTYDGRFRGFLAYEELAQFGKQICVLGPIAGVFGRQLEQYLISPGRRMNEFLYSRKSNPTVNWRGAVCFEEELVV